MGKHNNKSSFGGIFDFNHDGKTSPFEQYIGYKIFEECLKELENEEDDDNDKYEWRLTCENGWDYDIDPEDYETEFEYMEALEKAKENCCEPDEKFDDDKSYTFIGEDVNPDDYPNKRRYTAAFELANLPDYINDDYLQRERNFCKFIVEKADTIIAANYLAYEEGFLYSQAIKDNFNLDISLPDEDEERVMTFPAVLCKIAKYDADLSFKVWNWCFEQFLPYNEYYDSCAQELSTDVIIDLHKFPKDYISKLAHHISENENFCNALLTAGKSGISYMGELIATVIKEHLYETAKKLFEFELEKVGDNYEEIMSLTNSVLINCIDDYEVESLEYFRDNLLSIVKSLPNEMVQFELPTSENLISSMIERTESMSPKYAYSRKFAWRKNAEDGSQYGLDPLNYYTEQQYKDALNRVKYRWREKYIFQNTYGLNVNDYETENDFRSKLDEEKRARNTKQAWQKIAESNTEEKTDIPKYKDDIKVYTYCGVLLPSSDRPYSYIANDDSIKIGDKVIVPFGKDNEETEGTVVYVGQYSRFCVPYPIEKTKTIIKKIQENTNNGQDEDAHAE